MVGVWRIAVADEEDVLSAAFADVAGDVERDPFGVAVGDRFHLDERGVRVVRGALRHRRQGVGRHARPGGDLHVAAFLERLFAEVGAPVPQHDRGVDGTGERVHAERFVAAIEDRTDVARLHLVRANRVEDGILPARQVERILHPVDLRGVLQPLHVRVEPEAGRSLRRGVAAGAFEHAAAVVDDVRGDVDGRVLPRHQLAVHPDLARPGKCHRTLLRIDSNAIGELANW